MRGSWELLRSPRTPKPQPAPRLSSAPPLCCEVGSPGPLTAEGTESKGSPRSHARGGGEVGGRGPLTPEPGSRLRPGDDEEGHPPSPHRPWQAPGGMRLGEHRPAGNSRSCPPKCPRQHLPWRARPGARCPLSPGRCDPSHSQTRQMQLRWQGVPHSSLSDRWSEDVHADRPPGGLQRFVGAEPCAGGPRAPLSALHRARGEGAGAPQKRRVETQAAPKSKVQFKSCVFQLKYFHKYCILLRHLQVFVLL